MEVCDCLKETASAEVLKIMQEAIQEASQRTGTAKAKSFLGEIERWLTVKGDVSNGDMIPFKEEFQTQYNLMGQEAKQVLKNITELGILTNDSQPHDSDEDSAESLSESDHESAQSVSESESQNSVRHRPKRTKRN